MARSGTRMPFHPISKDAEVIPALLESFFKHIGLKSLKRSARILAQPKKLFWALDKYPKMRIKSFAAICRKSLVLQNRKFMIPALLTVVFLAYLSFALPAIIYVSPTLQNASFTANNWLFANATIDEPQNRTIIEMNSQNYTIYEPSLVLNLPFGEGSGTTAYDNSMYGNNGTLYNMNPGINNGSSGWTSSGKFGKALQFDGVNANVNVGNSTSLDINNNAITVEAWVYSRNSSFGADRMILDKTGAFRFHLTRTWTDQPWFYIWNSTGQTDSTVFNPVPVNTWTHLAATYSNATGLITGYQNGIQVSQSTHPGGMAQSSYIALTIGTIDGTIDEVRIYNRSLSATEIAQHYNMTFGKYYANFTNLTDGAYNYRIYAQNTTGSWNASNAMTITVDATKPAISFVSPTDANNSFVSRNWTYVNVSASDANNITAFVDFNRSLVGWWRFNEGTGTNAQDFSSWGNNGTLTNMNPGINNCTGNCSGWTSSGKFGKALMFDGSNDEVQVPDKEVFKWKGGSFSYGGWFKAGTQLGSGYVLSKPWNGWGEYNYWLRYTTFNNKLNVQLFGNTSQTWNSNAVLTEGQWYYAIVTIDDAKNVKLFINGNLDFSTTHTIYNWTPPNNDLNLALMLGNIYPYQADEPPNYYHFNGTIDEVRIYNRALSPEEINASYNAGLYRLYHNFTNLTSGTYNYTAYAQDLAGNVNQTETRTLAIDTVAPASLAFVSPTLANNSYSQNNWYYVNLTFTEANPDTCILASNGANSSMARIGANCYLNKTGLADGNYAYNVTVNDTAGNTGTSGNMQVTIDTTQPFIGFVSPTDANNSYASRNWTYINTTITDANPNSTGLIDFNRSLVGWWRFNEGSGTVAQDFSSYGNNGTLTNMNPGIDNCTGNCSGWTSSGKFGKAMQFDGVNDYVNAGNAVSSTTETTLSAWVKPTTLGTIRSIILSPNIGIYLNADGTVFSYIDTVAQGWHNGGNTVIAYSWINEWHYVTITYSAATNTTKYYRDGVEIYSDTYTSTGNLATIYGGTRIGMENNYYFNGSIDEVRIWNRALSPEEINASYNAGVYRLYHNFTSLVDGSYTYTAYAQDLAGNVNQTNTRTLTIDTTQPFIGFVPPTDANKSFVSRNWTYINTTITDNLSPNSTGLIDFNRSLVGWWRFNEGTGTIAQDFSSWGNNGTLTNMNTGIDNGTSGWTSSGKFGNALQFDGVDDYVAINRDIGVGNINYSSFEFWIYRNNENNSDSIMTNNGGSNTLFLIRVGNMSNWQDGRVLIYWGNNSVAPVSNLRVYQKYWYYVVLTVDVPNKNFTWYINGAFDSSSIYNGINNFTTSTFNIGEWSSQYVNGTLDEVRIWNRALSPEEINASYNAGIYRLYHNFTNLTDGTYNYTAYAQDLAGNVNQTETRTLTVDTTPPAGVSGLQNASQGATWIFWNWTNPADADFSYAQVWLGGAPVVNTSLGFYNATWLAPNASYTIQIRTTDARNNTNYTFVSNTAKTTGDTDTAAPSILSWSISPKSAINGTNVSLQMNASDNYAIHTKRANITLPDATSYAVLMLPANYTTSISGRYNITFYANDTSGNAVNVSDYFIASAPVTFNLSVSDYNGSALGSNITIYYESSEIARNASSGNYSLSVPDNIYDLKFWAFNSTLAALFRSVNLSANQGKVLILERTSVSGYLAAYAINNTFSISSAQVTLSYNGTPYTNEDYLGLYKCDGWNISARTCSGSWNSISFAQNKSAKTLSANVTSFSGFAIKQESAPQAPSSGGGAAFHGLEIAGAGAEPALAGSPVKAQISLWNSGAYDEENINVSLACPAGWQCESKQINITKYGTSSLSLSIASPKNAEPNNYTITAKAENSFVSKEQKFAFTVLPECSSDSMCKKDEACVKSACAKLFDAKILRADSPVQPGTLFGFTYLMKGMADIRGDVVVRFWLEKGGKKISSGSDTIYLGSFEQKTETASIFLPGDAPAGSYDFYVEVDYGKYAAQTHRAIEVSREVPLVLGVMLLSSPVVSLNNVSFSAVLSSNKDDIIPLRLEEKITGGGKAAWYKERYVMINKSVSIEESVSGLKAGNYVLELKGYYGNVSSEAAESFEIKAQESEYWRAVLPLAALALAALLCLAYFRKKKARSKKEP